jgi:hypothetical protein
MTKCVGEAESCADGGRWLWPRLFQPAGRQKVQRHSPGCHPQPRTGLPFRLPVGHAPVNLSAGMDLWVADTMALLPTEGALHDQLNTWKQGVPQHPKSASVSLPKCRILGWNRWVTAHSLSHHTCHEDRGKTSCEPKCDASRQKQQWLAAQRGCKC